LPRTTAEQQAAERKIRELLAKRATFQARDLAASKFLESLAADHKLPLTIDKQAIGDEGISLDTVISVDLKEVTLESALEQVLEPLGLDWTIHHEQLVATTVSAAKSPRYVQKKLYPVRELLIPLGVQVGDVDLDATPLADLIQAAIDPDQWQAGGGSCSVQALGDVLVLSASRRMHDRVERLFDELRRVQRAQPGQIELSAQDAAAEKILSQPARFDFRDLPLSQAPAKIAAEHKVTVAIDQQALEDAGLDGDTPVSLNVSNCELRSALRLLLEPLGLTYAYRHGTLYITSHDEVVTRVYNVRRLVRRGAGGEIRYAPLIDTLESAVSPAQWQKLGGAGSATPYLGMLVVSQSPAVHAEIRQLLGEITKARDQQRAAAGLPPTAPIELSAPQSPQAKGESMTVRIYKLRPGENQESAEQVLNQISLAEGQGQSDLKALIGVIEQHLKLIELKQRREENAAERAAQVVKAAAEVLPAVEPGSWKTQGGGGQAYPLPGAILVRQNAAGHAKIKPVLEKLGFETEGEAVGP
jgi:hypothetical protein